ncbi:MULTISPECIES: TonB-dependent receptor [Sphingomonadaceae]|uniref:TonB-dependent receptor n=1 Tax=Sphingomonadales TaxID=204457 RepID=UPI0027D821BE|nr:MULTISPECIES: TonB-dependent receptor plug domain-containing protein [Sphingomonadaceae]
MESLGQPLALDLIRLTVASSGTQGSLTQIRIRGAEANHTLVFVDGIDFNDPAAGDRSRRRGDDPGIPHQQVSR